MSGSVADWPIVSLADVCNKITDGTHQTPKWASAGIPFIFVSNIRDQQVSLETNKFVSVETFDQLTRTTKIDVGDVLYTAVGSYGHAAVIRDTRKFVFQRHIAQIKPNSRYLDSVYLAHVLENSDLRRQADSAATGIAQKTVTLARIKDFAIPLPPIEEQRRIAAILDQVDTLRRTRRRTLTRLNDLAQSIFYDMFGDPISNSKGWPVRKLEDFGTIDRGISKHRPRNAPELLGGPHPLIQTGDVAQSGDYITTYSTTYSDAGLNQSRKWPKGTLCITIAANIANTSILNFDACFPDSVVGFLAREEAVTLFVHNWFKIVRQSIERVAPAVAQKNINLAILRDLNVIAPPSEMIDQFSKYLVTSRGLWSLALPHATHLGNLFASLQQRAFRGELQAKPLAA